MQASSRRESWRTPGGLVLLLVAVILPALIGAPGIFLGLGLLAVPLYVVAVLRWWPATLFWALALLAAEYAGWLYVDQAPLAASTLIYPIPVLCCAVRGWIAVKGAPGGRPLLWQLLLTAVVVVVSLTVSAMALLAPALRLPAPTSQAALGAAAVVAILATTAIAEIRAVPQL
ncbi:MAG TPA: hypothetical protein VIA06_16190 [Candidatus Dormibacteraeota bacterium]|nr:hypothetical protein [Candidatus Dormibacteraeota bacterium]